MSLRMLKSKIVERGVKNSECAAHLGISPSTFSHKLSGDIRITLPEVLSLRTFLNLSDAEVIEVFFNKNEHKNAS